MSKTTEPHSLSEPSETEDRPPLGCPRAQAEQMLAAAQREGRSQEEATALNDLGVILASQRQPRLAVSYLEKALALAQQIGNPVLLCESRTNLAMALLGIPESERALALLDQALADARIRVDTYAEKLILDKLGTACGWLRRHGEALRWFEQALALAQIVGDEAHQADLLWQMAIQCAELEQKAQALARGQATILLLRKLRHPHVGWFAENLRKFSTTTGTESLPGAVVPSQIADDQTIPAQNPSRPAHLLRMAFDAAKSLAKFLSSGLQTVPAEVQRERLQICGSCSHYTGLRCRVCGCFLNIKTRMSHEECPLGKWQAIARS